MANRPLNFRQRDVTAFVKAAKKAGENVARIEIDREGTIVVYVGGGNKAAQPSKSRIALEKMIDDEETSVRSKLHR